MGFGGSSYLGSIVYSSSSQYRELISVDIVVFSYRESTLYNGS